MTSVLTLGVDSEMGLFLQGQGFNPIRRLIPTALELCETVCDVGCGAVLLGMKSQHEGASVAIMRRNNVNVPVIRIARGPRNPAWSNAAACFLDSGGDDVLEGPTQPEVVAASLRAVLRRADGIPANIARFEDESNTLVINITMTRVLLNGENLRLTCFEMEILLLLASHGGPVSRAEIARKLYGVDEKVANTIEVFVVRLRDKFRDAHTLLKTRRGLGYELINRVS